ncbi:MAG TPA: BamA/TamA family outer membrane protein [Casimicrobiaceae bacterium]
MTPRSPRRPYPRASLLALPLLLASAAALADRAEPPAPSQSAPGSASAPGAEALRYRVTIDAPAALRDVLAASVDLVRWQTYEDMSGSLFDALTRKAVDQAKEAAATEGYFAAAVDVAVDRAVRPLGVTLRVTPGAQASVRAVDLDVTGAATTDDAGRDAIARMRREWPLAAGAPFRQSVWGDAKSAAVETLAGSAFAAAKLEASEASVDPQASAVDISVTIASGPVFHAGDLEIQGLARYSATLVEHYRTAKSGDRYSVTELDQFVRRLNGTGYFASVHAAIDTDPANAASAPVHVSVIEAPPKKIEAGVGYSTDTAFRGNVSYRDVDVGARALQMYIDARLESKLQNASLRFVEPPAANGWSPATFARIERTDISSLVTQTAGIGIRMSSLDERNQWQYGAAFLTDRQTPFGQPSDDSRALYVDVERAWRRVDDLASPTQGWIALLQLGAGIPGVSTRTFGRAIARSALWQPLGRLWSFTARAEAGAVIAGARTDIPSTLLFRTGGDTTVRGYAFESLGLKQGDAVLPARYYAVASVEATRWVSAAWGIAGFVDAGNAFDQMADFRMAVGYGIGARVRTPIGPFRLDLAYGQQSRQVRLHFSVGLAF